MSNRNYNIFISTVFICFGMIVGSGIVIFGLSNPYSHCKNNNNIHYTKTLNEQQNIYNQVSYVIDGDTLKLQNQDIVRLIGINAPEIGEYYSSQAKRKLKQLITNKKIKFERDFENKDKYGRLLRYIWVDNALINAELVRLGYANAYIYSSNTKYKQVILNAQAKAKNKNLGIWAQSPNSQCIKISKMHINARGNDNINLNDEYIVFANKCNTKINMNNWTIKDNATHILKFQNFSLMPNKSFALYSGSGNNTNSSIYWNRKNPHYAIWNNNGDAIYLRDANGLLALYYQY